MVKFIENPEIFLPPMYNITVAVLLPHDWLIVLLHDYNKQMYSTRLPTGE